MSPYFVWNFLSPLRSLLDHSGSRVGWHTHMESKFRRFHHSHLSTSSSGTWKWACVQVRKRCVHHILITGSEGGEKSPLMWVISWDNLGLVTSPTRLPQKFRVSCSFKGFLPSTSHFFLLVSAQDQLEFQVSSRLSWSSHAQTFSAFLLEAAVICFKWVHAKSAALWTLKGLKASQGAKANNSCHDEIQTFKCQAQ